MTREIAENIVLEFGLDILKSEGMKSEKEFIQHGNISVYEHSFLVAVKCVEIADFLGLPIDIKSLVRGALLHDYFLYDWHKPSKSHIFHAFTHSSCALKNAECDFSLNDIEKNMIKSHMFPINPFFPRYTESMILCLADKISATEETVSGFFIKLYKRKGA
ncbi:MAG: HD domain-containing protein [Lachnospirales bacterium]